MHQRTGKTDWSDPAKFFRSIGQPVPEMLSPAETRAKAEARAKAIFGNYEQLQRILERHEATIQKRWTKKTMQQRIKILLQAWPDMPAVHRPDFDAFRKEPPQQRMAGTRHHDSFMWPHVNQEDLSQTKPLLLLLNARGRHFPSSFAAADCEAMHIGLVTRAITPIFLNEYTMILNGVTSVEEYGALLDWDSHEDAFDWMHTRKQFQPGEGLLVLQAQERLMGFLVECCVQVLHDIPQNTMMSDKYPVQPEPHLRTERETSGFDSLALMAAEAPYRLPAQLDLERVESLLTAKVTATEDHLWSLREDPNYFAQQLLDIRDHRQEMIKDYYNRDHPATEKDREGVLWGRIIVNVLDEAYLPIETFSELRDQAAHLRELQTKYESVISPTKDLPQDFLEALLRFRHFLKQATNGPLGQLRMVVVASRPLRKFYTRAPPADPDSPRISIGSRAGMKMTETERNLIWLLRTLWEDGDSLSLARLPAVVDELERLIQSDQGAEDLISPYVAGVIGDLSIISQCMHQLEIYQPWAQTFETSFEDSRKEHEAYFDRKAEPWEKILEAFQEHLLEDAVKLGRPVTGRFTYPIQRRRNKENVNLLRQAEANLDVFWAEVDRVFYATTGQMEGSSVVKLLWQPRLLQRTPEWVQPEQAKKAVQPPPVEQPLSAFYHGVPDYLQEAMTGSRASTQPSKTKVKTRGMTNKSSEVEDVAEDVANVALEDVQPTFKVDPRALKAFRTLFFNPAVTSSPGEVSWHDFLHAMSSTGFTAEKLYGSVWHFTPTRLDVEASIHFHEPHPRGKLSFTTTRRYGRRLYRTYGWTGDKFVLDK
ncbi:hypothetical protein FDECE_14598 [Fusarium decemcellulare]|nr:hypothetical protein FDECE_14598 [Fusarium decemcellulare]